MKNGKDEKWLKELQDYSAKTFETNGLTKELGMRLTEMSDGCCVGEIQVEKKHKNGINTVHGGTLFSLADTISGYAALTSGNYVTTANGSIDYMNAARDCERLICRAKVDKAGKKLIWVEAEVYDERDTLLCKGHFLYFVLGEIIKEDWEEDGNGGIIKK